MRCQFTAGTAAAFFHSSCGRFSPRSRSPSSAATAATCADTVFVTATDVTPSAARPARWQAAAIRARTLAIRSPSTERSSESVILSAGGPGHVAAAEQMHVQVRHRLPAVLVAVDDEPVAFRQPELLRQLDRDEVQV